jgi:arsenate reductase (glutaredoxin)
MTITLYGISNCDTVKRARAWFAQCERDIVFHDFKRSGVPEAALDMWLQQLGWERLLNRQGTTWRKLDELQRSSVVDAASAKLLMLAQPSVIKRPVVVWRAGQVTTGFDAANWAQRSEFT